jgi:hypothetical protein
MQRPFALFVAGLVVLACGGTEVSRTSGSQSAPVGAGASGGGGSSSGPSACIYPPAASTYDDASAAGCTPQPAASICQVSNGATVLPDGGVLNGTETCSSMCAPSHYELVCSGGGVQHPVNIPDPDPSLGCTVIPIPTPSDVLFYCCPCGS